MVSVDDKLECGLTEHIRKMQMLGLDLAHVRNIAFADVLRHITIRRNSVIEGSAGKELDWSTLEPEG